MAAPTNNHTAKPSGHIAPRLGVVVATLVGLAGLTFLIPDRDQLFKRFLSDGDANAASQLLTDAQQGDANAVTTSLTKELITLGHRSDWNTSTLEIITGFITKHDNFGIAADVIAADAASIPETPRNEILSALISRALAEADMDRAVACQDLLVSHAPKLTPDLVRQAVRTYRYNGDPGRALVLINNLDDQSAELPADLLALRVTLARETSQPDVAFNLINLKIRSARKPAELKELIPQAVKIGVEAGHLEQLVPLYRRYLSAFKDTNDPLVNDYSFKLAQTLEWTGNPNDAFTAYLTLARKGNVQAMERCITLNAGLYRPEDLLSALLDAEPKLGKDNPFLLITARLLAEAAEHDEAISHYERYLAGNPEDADAQFRLGLIHEERQEFEAAIAPLTRAHELDPSNPKIALHLTNVCIARQDYDLALKHGRSLANISEDPDHADLYSSIAWAVGDTDSYREALTRYIDLKPSPTLAFTLASSYSETGDFSQATAILSNALEDSPGEVPIRLRLASLHLLNKRPDQTIRVLKPLSLSKYPDTITTVVDALNALSVSPHAKQLPAALRHYGPTLQKSNHLPPNNLVDIANLELRYGSQSRGTQLFRRALRECSLPGPLAQAHFRLGNASEALHHQLAHIKKSPRPLSEDYHFLGDIYTALNKKTNASSAYNYAVVLLKKKLTRTPRR